MFLLSGDYQAAQELAMAYSKAEAAVSIGHVEQIHHSCRFRQLDSRVSMMEPTKDRVCNNISEPLDRACVGRVLPERNMSSYVIIIGDVFR
jgi:hypothetical protein